MLAAACTAIEGFGFSVPEPVVLQRSNHLVLRLDPHPIVAKAALRPEKHTALAIEMAVAQHLASKHVPAVRPAAGIPATVHTAGGIAMTFWELVETVERTPDVDIGASLAQAHNALADFEGSLPSWRDHHRDVVERLHGIDFPAPQAATTTLHRAAARINAALEGLQASEQPLLGEPHTNNVLAGPDGWVLCDFEAACTGPVESDLSFLPVDLVAGYGPHDVARRDLFSRATNLRVAVWCWLGADESPELLGHALAHTATLASWLAMPGQA